jgi:DNA-binding transcriptional regulator YiaG
MTSSDLKQIRLKLGLSQAALAKAVGVTTTTVYRWEAGLRTISKTAEILLLHLAKRRPS